MPRSVTQARRVNTRRRREANEAERQAVVAASWLVALDAIDDFTLDALEDTYQSSAAALDKVFATAKCPSCDEKCTEVWMVHDELWTSFGLRDNDGMWCRPCFELVLGRRLEVADFKEVPSNTEIVAAMKEAA